VSLLKQAEGLGGASLGMLPTILLFTALEVTVLKQTGGPGGVPLEMPPSKDKTISHGLDAVGGSVAFSIRFQAVLKPEKYN
jgi:hypothetical protein